ncbi:unnamed protein product [Eruca vesicaria subsp. sativa]|uniref:Uncharacterized protein n=1 Tax=Eruca vesicaria subsp. sativa TaxID=29727 RepID=A0ABC8JYY9_ERUVS|nr:unnamed protein product [Eruca vesicaria subsp. sativa]
MRSARELALEDLSLNTFGNLTMVVVCFLVADDMAMAAPLVEKQQCCSVTAEAFQSLRAVLDS